MARVVLVVSSLLVVMLAWCCSANLLTGYVYNNFRSGKCLAVIGQPVGWNTRVVSDKCDRTSQTSQLWKFHKYPSKFVHVPSGKCLDVVGLSNGREGAQVVLNTCNDDDLDQRWSSHSRFTHPNSGRPKRLMQIKNGLSGLCLDVVGDMDTADGVPTRLAQCQGFADETSDQWWWTGNWDDVVRTKRHHHKTL